MPSRVPRNRPARRTSFLRACLDDGNSGPPNVLGDERLGETELDDAELNEGSMHATSHDGGTPREVDGQSGFVWEVEVDVEMVTVGQEARNRRSSSRPSAASQRRPPLASSTMAPRSIPTETAVILPPLLSLVQSNAYSAHQKTRTTSARLISHGHPDEAIAVLFEVAKALLKTGETGSGVDLSTAMLAAYDGKAEQVTDESRGQFERGAVAPRGRERRADHHLPSFAIAPTLFSARLARLLQADAPT